MHTLVSGVSALSAVRALMTLHIFADVLLPKLLIVSFHSRPLRVFFRRAHVFTYGRGFGLLIGLRMQTVHIICASA